jgi:DNA helicase IV
MENNIAINPADFYEASSTLGWETIYGCVITHFSFGPGVIRSTDDLLHIHFFDDLPNHVRRFYPNIFLEGKVQDLEVSHQIAKAIETIKGSAIHKTDAKIARNRCEAFRKLKQYEFELAENLFMEIKDYLDPAEIGKYQAEKALREKEFLAEQNKKLLESTLIEIKEKLQAFRFSKARQLYQRISHLYSEADFEQEVLRYQIPYELNRFHFLEADVLFPQCKSITSEAYEGLRVAAIQKYFKKPETQVTHEQAIALADNQPTLLIKARAGSGKTRVLACKTALLIDRYKVNPDKILVLAFNKKAAIEISNRIRRVFGIESFENARTFHSLAYQLVKFNGEILFDNQGEFSRPALTTFVQQVLRSLWSPEIQSHLYQLFRKEMRSLEQSGGLLNDADYLAFLRNKRDITLNGDRVKSAGEKYIADFLFEHDIPYYYERVEFWSGHSYRPDFTLFQETGQVVIEFWGIDENDPSRSLPKGWSITWDQYHFQMGEKRRYWKEKGIPLVELSIADTHSGRCRFEEILEERLAEVGVKNEKLEKKDLEKKVIRCQKDRMTELFVQFIQRAKKQMWSVEEVQKKVHTYHTSDDRVNLFLTLGCQVYLAYQKKLAETNSIDFDDLIITASKLIRETQGLCTIDLGPRKERHQRMKEIEWILVDEFQDFSSEFHFLLDSIRAVNPKVRLICVGDNWQAINSFAGSDLRFFEQFAAHFQNSNTVNLLTNHRSQKAIVDFGNMVMGGHGEQGTSSSDHIGGKVEIQSIDGIRIEYRDGAAFEEEKTSDQRFVFYEVRETGKKVNDNGFLQAKYLKACYQIIKEPENWECITRPNTTSPIVAILSRKNMLYRVSLDEFLDKLKNSFTSEEIKEIGDFREKVKISTVHRFKGLEAEIVIVLRVCDGSFPLLHPDNSLFEMFGQTEKHVIDEERRLFYVSVTRPSQRLYILTEQENESSFL